MKRAQSISARHATVALYVAVISLLTCAIALVTAIVRLAVTLVSSAASYVPRRAVQVAPPAKQAATTALRLVPNNTPAPVGAQAERLTTALTGMGFAVPAVRRFVSGLGVRVESDDIALLIKDGLRALAA